MNYLDYTIEQTMGFLNLKKEGSVVAQINSYNAKEYNENIGEIKRLALISYIISRKELHLIAITKLMGLEGQEDEFILLCQTIAKEGLSIPEEIASGGVDKKCYIYFNNRPLNQFQYARIIHLQ